MAGRTGSPTIVEVNFVACALLGHYSGRIAMTRTERTFYILSALYYASAWFLAPVYPLFLLSRGLDLFQMNLVLATFFIGVFLFEVPTGAVADRFGRKRSFLLSCAIRTVAFLMYAFATDFDDCLAAEVVDAIGQTLASGALNAWAVDGIRAEGNRVPTHRLLARAQILMRAVMIVGGVVGGYVAEVDLALPWFIAAGGFVVTGLLAVVLMKETLPAQPAAAGEAKRRYVDVLSAGLRIVWREPIPFVLSCFTAAMMFAVTPAHMLWQVRIESIAGTQMWLLGWIWALVNVAVIGGSLLLPYAVRQVRREVVLCAASLWHAAMLLIAAYGTGLGPVVIAIVLQGSGFGVADPFLESWMNEHTRSEERATVLSVRSMFGTFGGAAGLVCLGLIARAHGVPIAWTICAVLLAASGVVLLLFSRTLAQASCGCEIPSKA